MIVAADVDVLAAVCAASALLLSYPVLSRVQAETEIIEGMPPEPEPELSE